VQNTVFMRVLRWSALGSTAAQTLPGSRLLRKVKGDKSYNSISLPVRSKPLGRSHSLPGPFTRAATRRIQIRLLLRVRKTNANWPDSCDCLFLAGTVLFVFNLPLGFREQYTETLKRIPNCKLLVQVRRGVVAKPSRNCVLSRIDF